jgi:hypothetical protein
MTSANGTKRTLGDVRCLVANGGKADMAIVQSDFRVWAVDEDLVLI